MLETDQFLEQSVDFLMNKREKQAANKNSDRFVIQKAKDNQHGIFHMT